MLHRGSVKIFYCKTLYCTMNSWKELQTKLIEFRNDRDWEQFHNPKDLALALSIEAAELNEEFLWKNAEDANVEKIKEELADVFAYALLLAEKYDLDINEIVIDKIKKNGEKYPIDKSKGTATKYTDL
jgi:NTP pyrophosphatase (non-canonical NTP hydrolase)